MSRFSYRQARWAEPIVLELGRAGERGVVPPRVEPEISAAIGEGLDLVPESVRRLQPPALPEIAQPRVLRHFLRLSQEAMGAAVGVDIGQGTATMKYSPVMHERLARMPQLTEVHPLQPDETVQGLLQAMYEFEQVLRQISGLDRFSFQPGGGTHGLYANACIVRAYHESRGEGAQRDEVITTVFSHPSDAAAPATAGYSVVTLHPGERGFPDFDALKAALSERTAALVVANPEDTGIFNPDIDRFVDEVHAVGGLCVYDQANANGIIGVTRAGDADFDLCQFNLHKTFSSPHGSGGLACGAIGARAGLARFLPAPLVARDGERFVLDYARPDAIGRIRAFHGVASAVIRSLAWTLALGPEGIRRSAETAVLNNNYLAARLAGIPGIAVSFAEANATPRLEQVRYSLAKLAEETGVGTEDVSRRSADAGFSAYFPSHHPWVVPEPATLEPTESASRDDLDAYVETMRAIASEARSDPERVMGAPHASAIHRIDTTALDDPSAWALTWRAHLRRRGMPSPATALAGSHDAG